MNFWVKVGGALLVLSSAPAHSTIVVQWEGQIYLDGDQLNFFRETDESLVGKVISATFLLPEPTHGQVADNWWGDYGWNYWEGKSAPAKGRVTINGVNFDQIYKNYIADMEMLNNDPGDYLWFEIENRQTIFFAQAYSDIELLSDVTLESPIFASGMALPDSPAYTAFAYSPDGQYLDPFTLVWFNPTALAVYRTDSPPEIPEPAGWMLMLAGFSAIGTAARRTRRVRVSVGYG
jgi:hypothetical protein